MLCFYLRPSFSCTEEFLLLQVGRVDNFVWAVQSNPPSPTNPDVTIETKPGGLFAVTQFGGFVVEQNTLISKRDYLAAALESDGIAFNNDSFVYAGYDSPARQPLPTFSKYLISEDSIHSKFGRSRGLPNFCCAYK